MTHTLRVVLVSLFVCLPAFAQKFYGSSAGKSAPTEAHIQEKIDAVSGLKQQVRSEVAVQKDGQGNAQGSQYDLAVDGAFKGKTIAVLQEYVDPTFDFSMPKTALAQKGFNVVRWIGGPPPLKEFEATLEKSNQFWLISGSEPRLTAGHIAAIKRFYEAGHGVYIWGDNEPYYVDANALGKALIGVTMLGNLLGTKTVGLQEKKGAPGILPNHLLSTGLEHLYEGHTIATVNPNQTLSPLLYGSAGNLVSGFSDADGKRIIFDGGFTRLYIAWDEAGTARYVKNAAAWLANVERFGDQQASR